MSNQVAWDPDEFVLRINGVEHWSENADTDVEVPVGTLKSLLASQLPIGVRVMAVQQVAGSRNDFVGSPDGVWFYHTENGAFLDVEDAIIVDEDEVEAPEERRARLLKEMQRLRPILETASSNGIIHSFKMSEIFDDELVYTTLVVPVAEADRPIYEIIQSAPSIHDESLLPWATSATKLLDLYGAGQRQLECVRFVGGNLQRADLREVEMPEASMPEADLLLADLGLSKIIGGDLTRAKVSSVRFDGAVITGMMLHEVSGSQASFRGATLTGAQLTSARLRSANFDDADLSETNFGGAALTSGSFHNANVEGAGFSEANLCGANLSGISGTPASRSGCIIDFATYDNSDWAPGDLAEWSAGGARILDLNLFPYDARQAVLGAQPGLTLTFSNRIHRFDPTAFNLLILEVLGSDPDVSVEASSPLNVEGVGWIRINGTRGEDLLLVAEAFHNRVWAAVHAAAEKHALQQMMSTGLVAIINTLDGLRDSWEGASINHPDVQEMLLDQASEHVAKKDQALLRTRFQKVATAVREEAQARTGLGRITKALGDQIEGGVGGLTEDE